MKHTDPDISLYSYRRCPFAIRVRMVPHEKQLPFKTIEEDLKSLSADLKRLHPEGKVPLLVDEGTVVYESAIITEYLNDKYPSPDLMPTDAVQRMHVREWTYWCNHIFKPQIDRFKYGSVRLTQDEVNDASRQLDLYVERIDTSLEASGWLVGDCFSLADVHVFPFFRQLLKVNPPHPNIHRYARAHEWYEKISSRSSYERAMQKSGGTHNR